MELKGRDLDERNSEGWNFDEQNSEGRDLGVRNSKGLLRVGGTPRCGTWVGGTAGVRLGWVELLGVGFRGAEFRGVDLKD